MSFITNKSSSLELLDLAGEEKKRRRYSDTLSYVKLLKSLQREFIKKWDHSIPATISGVDDYERLSIIGTGSFGHVGAFRHKENYRVIAIKCMLKDRIVKNNQVTNVISEKRVLQAADFPFVVQLFFARKDDDYLYLAMPFYSSGDMFNLLQRWKTMTEDSARFYASQVFMGLDYLHGSNVIYRDLKTENILINIRGYIRLTDFGFAKRVLNRTMTLCGTPEYMAPEIIQGRPYAASVDWWAFGILIYELLTGTTPFGHNNVNSMLMYEKICAGEYSIPASFSDEVADLVSNLLKVEMTERYGSLQNGSADIKDHPWFESVSWFRILNGEAEPPYVPNQVGDLITANFPTYESVDESRSSVDNHNELFHDF